MKGSLKRRLFRRAKKMSREDSYEQYMFNERYRLPDTYREGYPYPDRHPYPDRALGRVCLGSSTSSSDGELIRVVEGANHTDPGRDPTVTSGEPLDKGNYLQQYAHVVRLWQHYVGLPMHRLHHVSISLCIIMYHSNC